jgi:hypothetical protein
MIINLRDSNPSPLRFLVSCGIGFPVAFFFVFLGGRRIGFDIRTLPMWLLFAVFVAIGLVTYVSVHFLPPKPVTIAGVLGWLTVFLVLLIKVF